MDATITVLRRSISTPMEFRTDVSLASSFEKALQDGDGEKLNELIHKLQRFHDYCPELEDSFVSEPHVFSMIRGVHHWCQNRQDRPPPTYGQRWFCVARTCVTAQQFESLARKRLELMWVPEPYMLITDWTLDIKQASRDLKKFI